LTNKLGEARQLVVLGYSDKAIEFYQHETNVGVIDSSTTDAVSLGPSGDLIRLYLKLDGETIADSKFLCFGCPASSASMSALTMLITGKPLSYAKKLTAEDVLKNLGGLPEEKQDCAELAISTLKKVLAEYEKPKDSP
jgi:nitrogen fixation NifU-like protein